MTNDLFDNTNGEIVPKTSVEELLEKALSDTERWILLLNSDAEDPDFRLTQTHLGFFPNAILDCETIAAQPTAPEDLHWALGLAGHGLANIYFCCNLRTPRLKIALSIPYRRTYDASQISVEELYRTERTAVRATCSAVLFLIHHEIAKRDYANHNPDARLTITYDRNGTAFQIDDAQGTVAKGNSWKHLVEKYLEPTLPQGPELQFFKA